VQREKPSFAGLWGIAGEVLPLADGTPRVEARPAQSVAVASPPVGVSVGRPAPLLPDRVLPHQLAHAPDLVRTLRHESALDEPAPGGGSDEAIDYGLWWHGMMEFLPWAADADGIERHAREALAQAGLGGFGDRAAAEWARLQASAAWRELRAGRWTRQTEIGILAPLPTGAWIDGVMDLVLHDPAGRSVWVVDWKTNRRREGEDEAALLARLAAVYAPQLRAYGACLAALFPDCEVRRLVYSTVAGTWCEVTEA
jgi:hypothetical protein